MPAIIQFILFNLFYNALICFIFFLIFNYILYYFIFSFSYQIYFILFILLLSFYFFYRVLIYSTQFVILHSILFYFFSPNLSYHLYSVFFATFHFNIISLPQVCRALVPVIVMAISMLYYGKSFSIQRKLSVLPIVFGVALAFYGDMSFTAVGAFYTLFCVVLAALKAVAGGELLTGDLKLHEIDLLSKMCPLALLQIGLVSVLTGTLHMEISCLFIQF